MRHEARPNAFFVTEYIGDYPLRSGRYFTDRQAAIERARELYSRERVGAGATDLVGNYEYYVVVEPGITLPHKSLVDSDLAPDQVFVIGTDGELSDEQALSFLASFE